MTRLLNAQYVGEGLSLMQKHWLTFPQIVTLFMLRNDGPRSISEVAGRINLSRAATSHLVDRLVKKRFVVREKSTHDRRHKLVTLTERGMSLVEALDQSRLRRLSSLVSVLSPELQHQFVDLLDRLIVHLNGDRPEGRPLAE
ncbi:MAG: MarR family transcriptional regulator [Myxococcales bacterium]|nr:MarR family transcriptional regulator [Myxococcales bacterium]